MPDITLSVPYELETDPRYGGAAAVRMTLNASKINANLTDDQKSIYAFAHARNDASEPSTAAWDIDPKGLKDTLNAKDPRGPGWFIEASFTDRPSADGKLKFTIDSYQVPPSVVTAAGREWVTVIGYRTDSTGKLEAFQAHDPSELGLGPGRWYFFGTKWDQLFTPVEPGTRWKGKYVTICDPQPEGDAQDFAPRRIKRDGDRVLGPDEAIELAREGVLEAEFQESPEFVRAIEDGKPGEPLLVQAIGNEDDYYYLVPFLRDSEVALGVAIVDARFGDLGSVTASAEGAPFRVRTRDEVLRLVTEDRDLVMGHLEERQQSLAEAIAELTEGGRADPRELRALLMRHLAWVREPLHRQHFRPETTQVSSVLVWTPLLPAASFANPYYVVTSGKQQVFVKARVTSHPFYEILEAIEIPYSNPGN
jgi:hypothetical protein